MVSCGSSQEEIALKQAEVALKANCERILSNFEAMHNRSEVFPGSDVADEDSVALLLGKETRQAAEKEILATFPFLDKYIVGQEKNKHWDKLFKSSGVIFVLSQGLNGTDIELPYSAEEMNTIATQENEWTEVVGPLAAKIFGEDYYSEDEDPQGCALIDLSKQDANSDNNTSVAFDRAWRKMLQFADFLQAIRNCEVSAWHKDNKCSKQDYVSEPSDYTPSTEPSDEELAILAEREEAAEREAERPSDSVETSNAKPFQFCSALGKLVQTESYGELQCRVIWTNRVKSLIWMRTGGS